MLESLPHSSNASVTVTVTDIGAAIFESSNDCVKMLDTDGCLLSMNKNGQCIMEIDDFSMVAGLVWSSLWPPESSGAIRQALADARAGRTAHFQAFCPTAKATPKWWDVIVTPVLGAGGQVEKILSISRDVTEARRANEDLRASRERFSLLLESSSEGIYGIGPGHICSFINQAGARMLGYEPAELIGRQLHGVLHHHHADGSPYPWETCRLGKAVAGGVAVRIEDEVFWHKDGRAIAVSYAVAPMAGSGANAGAVVTFADITERRAAEEHLREVDRRKDEFLAMLAHELRNPLAPIRAAADLLKLGESDAARVRQTSDIIARQVLHMTNLVDDLLDVSRVTRGLVTLEKSARDMRHIVTDAVEQANPLIRKKQHELVLHLTPADTTVLGDNKRLVQIVSNLLHNAAKYTPAGGTIVLRTEVEQETVLLTVSDNGIGIDRQLAARVFDLFAQAEHTPDRSSGGLGLGLALVKNLVELHGGSVSCTSAGAGQGSTFRVALPRLAVGDAHGVPVEGVQQEVQPAKDLRAPLRLLLVDDNIDAATMLGMLLEASEHVVTVVHSASDALARIEQQPFDVCLLDIGLPEMDGNTLARRLRADARTAACMLIAITGYGQESDRRNTSDAGFDYHFIKPVDTSQLLALLTESRNKA